MIEFEGFSETPYYDNLYLDTRKGQHTWGYGTRVPLWSVFNLLCNQEVKITKEQAEKEVEKYIIAAFKCLKRKLGKNLHKLNDTRREAFIDMIYNIGCGAFGRFKRMHKELKKETINWQRVAAEIIDSRYYRNHPCKRRVLRVVNEIAMGVATE